MTEQRQCTMPGCERVYEGRGYCKMHNKRLQRRGFLGGPVSTRKVYAVPGCQVDGCLTERSSGGYCAKHYARIQKYGTPADPPKVPCSVQGCLVMVYPEGVQRSSGLCRLHIMRRHRGTDMNMPYKVRAKDGSRLRRIDPYGYVRICGYQGHPNAAKNGMIAEHTLVMVEYLQRPLLKGENVHHRNGIRHDNRLENLELWHIGQPPGQRVVDKLAWARDFIAQYADYIEPS